MEEWDDEISYDGYRTLSEEQRVFLEKLMNEYGGIGYKLFINRVLLNNRYHIVKDKPTLTEIRKEFINMLKNKQ